MSHNPGSADHVVSDTCYWFHCDSPQVSCFILLAAFKLIHWLCACSLRLPAAASPLLLHLHLQQLSLKRRRRRRRGSHWSNLKRSDAPECFNLQHIAQPLCTYMCGSWMQVAIWSVSPPAILHLHSGDSCLWLVCSRRGQTRYCPALQRHLLPEQLRWTGDFVRVPVTQGCQSSACRFWVPILSVSHVSLFLLP